MQKVADFVLAATKPFSPCFSWGILQPGGVVDGAFVSPKLRDRPKKIRRGCGVRSSSSEPGEGGF